jgi:hypothetical protein
MADGSKASVTNPAQPPYGNGQGATSSAGASRGGHDFIRDPKSAAPAVGGRDFTKESRPQSEARREVVPNPQEIPAGGTILKADPGSVGKSVSGTADSPTAQRRPFRVR